MTASESDSRQIDLWVLSSQEGDKDAFADLYEYFFDKIYRYVYFRVHASHVDDIVETVFIKCWMNIEKYEKRDVSFAAWLFRIAHNAVIDYRRSHRNIFELHERIVDEKDTAAPEKKTEQVLLRETMKEAIDELADPYRQVVSMKFLSGLSNAEIADAIGRKEGNIRVIQFRALKELRQKLEERGFKVGNL